MTERHWSNEELLDALYGVGPADGHTDRCPECRERLRAVEEQRQQMTGETEVSFALLAAQRRAVYRRLEDPASPRFQFRLAPVLATAAVLLCAVLLSGPAPERQETAAAAPGDGHFYTEIYSMLNKDVPRAAGPIDGLFE